MVGVKDVIRGLFWYSGLLLMDLPCMMGICDPYMASALFMSSMVIGHFLI